MEKDRIKPPETYAVPTETPNSISVQKVNTPQFDSAFARALNRVLHDGKFTAAELAEVAECSPRHIYQVRNGEANLELLKAERIARYCSERGELRLSRAFLHDSLDIVSPSYCRPDGWIDDDVTELVKCAALVARDHHNGINNPDSMSALRVAVERMQAEINLASAKHAA